LSLTTTIPFEILVATMHRTDLSFLKAMFPEDDYRRFQILVINQTDDEHPLESDSDSIRVINTKERGLSNSRNMGIANALGAICLVADDDVRYVKGFEVGIQAAFAKAKKAAVITFQVQDETGNLYRDYPAIEQHTKKTVFTVNGVVIAFRTEDIRLKELGYDSLFGLGATFETADEYVFMCDVLKAGLIARFEPLVILTHPAFNSGMASGSDRIIFARAALKQKYLGRLSYLWVFKYVRFLVAHNYISKSEFWAKLKVGFAGIKKYKQLVKHQ
jgi:glycosyltransferase involved in cell wall biosynthesis